MIICVWNKCNNRCLMCSNPADFYAGQAYDLESIRTRLSSSRFRKEVKETGSILLTGGEPTLSPHFLETLKLIRKQYPEATIHLLTNGRRFFYLPFARRTMKVRNLKISVPIHGHNKQLHEKITRTKDSFKQSLGGLKNILDCKNDSLNQRIFIRMVISKLNYRHLDKMTGLAASFFPLVERVVLIFSEMEGQALKNFKRVSLSYRTLKPYLAKLLPVFSSYPDKFCLYHFPLCVLEPKFWPFAWRTLAKEEITFLASCKKCKYRKYCLGIPRSYLEAMGSQEFAPVRNQIDIMEKGDFYHPIKKIKEK